MSIHHKQLKKSKRNALRFRCNKHRITYKTAYDEGEAYLTNISSGGCAFESATIPLTVHEKILISIEIIKTGTHIEAKAIVVRAEENFFAVKFILIEPSSQKLLISYFTKTLRDQ